MWSIWRPAFGWEHLCPVLFADPIGLFVIMPRAAQPVTFNDLVAAASDCYPDTTTETKPEDFGRLGPKVVAVDYGAPDRESVTERRAYYRDKLPSTR